MTARTATSSLLARAGVISAIALATVGGTLVVPGAAGDAEAASTSASALRVAASKKGAPYKYGASGPYRFDCSGLTLYSFKRAGKRLPRTAAAQYNRTRHLSASSRRLGDLVFFHSRRGIYHVGIYAGKGKIWHAPKPGAVVRLERIWSHSVSYGRVR
ncbi:glycoside hydrolase [Streptomyces sp. CB02923]|uniref:C40 family peptidase n=1 Tax=Streptomyces sp. CB02923 TaxID=1718985 RepID=UPI00093FD516|nr:NlpC/P60 family protein [Streptomyces sp. CB02923]OKI01975.1 glycoside hydrolase [Streptomyces sp. CB02923]